MARALEGGQQIDVQMRRTAGGLRREQVFGAVQQRRHVLARGARLLLPRVGEPVAHERQPLLAERLDEPWQMSKTAARSAGR